MLIRTNVLVLSDLFIPPYKLHPKIVQISSLVSSAPLAILGLNGMFLINISKVVIGYFYHILMARNMNGLCSFFTVHSISKAVIKIIFNNGVGMIIFEVLISSLSVLSDFKDCKLPITINNAVRWMFVMKLYIYRQTNINPFSN